MSGNQDKRPAVSIIIPARDEADFLPRCLDAINALESVPGGIESIVVDNDSSDKTPRIAERLGSRVVRAKNGTVARLRNLGAADARANVLGFVDADCSVDPAWAKTALEHFTDPAGLAIQPCIKEAHL